MGNKRNERQIAENTPNINGLEGSQAQARKIPFVSNIEATCPIPTATILPLVSFLRTVVIYTLGAAGG